VTQSIAVAGPAETAARMERIGPLTVVRLRHVGPYNDVGETFARLAAWVGAHELFGPWTQGLGISYADPEVTPQERPYAGLAVAYAGLVDWWLRHGDGKLCDAPALEFYLNQPGQTALTKICLAVAR
jgi:DNA gyrase inhibitor GyrI